jgi:hypothetical protein
VKYLEGKIEGTNVFFWYMEETGNTLWDQMRQYRYVLYPSQYNIDAIKKMHDAFPHMILVEIGSAPVDYLCFDDGETFALIALMMS